MNFRTLFESKTEEEHKSLESVEGDWEEAIFICAKCASKIRGEMLNGRTRLREEIKDNLRYEKIKGVRVLEVSCLDVCEKNRIAIATSFKSPIGKKIILVPPSMSGKNFIKSVFENEIKF